MTKPNVQAPESSEEIIYEQKNDDGQVQGTKGAGKSGVLPKETYKFPLNLSSNFPGRIRFTAHKIEGLDIIGGVQSVFTDAIKSVRETLSDVNEASKEAAGFAESPSSVAESKKTKGEKSGIGESIRGAGNAIDQSTQTIFNKEKENNPVGEVMLPLYRGVQFGDGANYTSANLGVLGAGINELISDQGGLDANKDVGNAVLGMVANQVGQYGGEVLGAAIGAKTGGAGGFLLGAVVGDKAFEGLAGAVQSATRIVSAPNKKTLFQDMNLRNFAFQFKMVAVDRNEAEEIKKILKFFRKNMYPEAIKFKSGNRQALPFAYRFPNVFDIDILNSKPDGYPAFKIQRCYLTNVDTTFNQTATGGMFDGEYFVEVDVSLRFQEINVLERDLIEDGY